MSKDRWLDESRVDVLFDELSWVPESAWTDIVKNAVEKWDSWPRNFPKAIKALWYDWQAKRRATFETTDCKYCDGEGLLRFDQEFPYGIYEMTCACGHCENWHKQFGESLEWTDRDTGRQFKVKRLTLDEIRSIEQEIANSP